MLLVDVGADVTIWDVDGWTALHFAATYSHTKLTKFLVDAGVNVDEQTESGQTSLHLCSGIHMAKYLIIEVRILHCWGGGGLFPF
jgi:ankyrin repeat protein